MKRHVPLWLLLKCRQRWETCVLALSEIAYPSCVPFSSRTYFDNIVAIDSLLEHIMVGRLLLSPETRVLACGGTSEGIRLAGRFQGVPEGGT